MPQLSPLNWILLFIMFWVAVITTSVLIWWSSKVYFSAKSSGRALVSENKWSW